MNNVLKILSLTGKIVGFVAGLNAIPFVSPQAGLYIFAGASILKDIINRAGDVLDDGKENQSFRP